MAEVIKNRYEFTILFDVENGNPNGGFLLMTLNARISLMLTGHAS